MDRQLVQEFVLFAKGRFCENYAFSIGKTYFLKLRGNNNRFKIESKKHETMIIEKGMRKVANMRPKLT